MQIFKKLKTNKANRQAAEELLENYRNQLDNKVLETLSAEDFENIITIAKSADCGSSTAIQAAYSMGYEAGQAALKGKIKTEFLKGGANND